MPSRRAIETAGFFVIAAALHVSAAGLMLPDQVKRGAPQDAPPAALAAGSADIQELVAEWDAPPAAETESVQPEQTQPVVEDMPDTPPAPMPEPETVAMAQPTSLPQPEAAARPNLPPPPEAPPVEIDKADLPELRNFEPPEIEVEPALALSASERPAKRPSKPAPKRQATKKEPAKPKQAQPQKRSTKQQTQQAAAPSRAGQGGQANASRSGGGGGGVSAQQRASIQAKWQAQISACLLRSIARTSGGSGLRATLSIHMGRNGRVQAAQVTGSSGNARVDREIARGAKRARCPAAPKALTQASYAFTQPVRIR